MSALYIIYRLLTNSKQTNKWCAHSYIWWCKFKTGLSCIVIHYFETRLPPHPKYDSDAKGAYCQVWWPEFESQGSMQKITDSCFKIHVSEVYLHVPRIAHWWKSHDWRLLRARVWCQGQACAAADCTDWVWVLPWTFLVFFNHQLGYRTAFTLYIFFNILAFWFFGNNT